MIFECQLHLLDMYFDVSYALLGVVLLVFLLVFFSQSTNPPSCIFLSFEQTFLFLMKKRKKGFLYIKTSLYRQLQENLTDEMVGLAQQLKESSLMINRSLQNTEKVRFSNIFQTLAICSVLISVVND